MRRATTLDLSPSLFVAATARWTPCTRNPQAPTGSPTSGSKIKMATWSASTLLPMRQPRQAKVKSRTSRNQHTLATTKLQSELQVFNRTSTSRYACIRTFCNYFYRHYSLDNICFLPFPPPLPHPCACTQRLGHTYFVRALQHSWRVARPYHRRRLGCQRGRINVEQRCLQHCRLPKGPNS